MKYLIHVLSYLLSTVLLYSAWVLQSAVALFWLKFFTVVGIVIIPLALGLLFLMLFVDEQKVAAECKKGQVGPVWYGVGVAFSLVTLVFYVWHGFIAYAVAQVILLLLSAVSHVTRGVFASKHKESAVDKLSAKEIELIKEALGRHS